MRSCSFKEPTTTGDRYLRTQYREGSRCLPSLYLLPDFRHHRQKLTGLSQRQSSRVPPPARGLPPCGSPHTPSQAIRPRSPARGQLSRGAPLPARWKTKLQRVQRGRATPTCTRSSSTHQAVQISARRRCRPFFLGCCPPRAASLFSGRWCSAVTRLHWMRGPAFLKYLCTGKDPNTATLKQTTLCPTPSLQSPDMTYCLRHPHRKPHLTSTLLPFPLYTLADTFTLFSCRCIKPSEIFTPMDSAASSKEKGPWSFSANSRRPS